MTKRVAGKMKYYVHKTEVRPTMLNGWETVALTERDETELEVEELKQLMFILGVLRLEKIRNENIRCRAHAKYR